tara:strand:- start:512 stop:1183 length:672 start_codon:yes stop_codon:yes gene_type:complete
MTKIQNNEITHTGNSGTSNLVLGSSGEVTPSKLKFGSDAAGDIAYYNGTGYTRLAKGSTGHYLKQGGSNAPEWAAVVGANILQIKIDIQGNSDIQSSYSSATLTDMNSVTITPTATSSKFLVWSSYRSYFNGNGDVAHSASLLRNVAGGGFSSLYAYGADTVNQTSSEAASQFSGHWYIDAPTYSAGNALIYKSQASSAHGSALNLGKYTELVVIELASGTAP